MLVSAQSTDPKSYNTVRANFEVPWKCKYVKYYVSSMNTMCDIMMITKDDYIEIELVKEEEENEIKKINFRDYYPDSNGRILALTLNIYCSKYMKWEYVDTYRVLTMTPSQNIIIRNMSHIVALVTGLYNTK